VGSRAIYCAWSPLNGGGKLAERNKLRDYEAIEHLSE
jgi:hypothetical protein